MRRVKDLGGCGEADGGLVVTNREQRGTVEKLTANSLEMRGIMRILDSYGRIRFI